MVGTGVQARYQLEYLRKVLSCRDLLLWGRSLKKVEALNQELVADWSVETANETSELLERCDVIITTTCAREAVLQNSRETNRPASQLIICIGADAPGKYELDPSLVASADTLLADSLAQCHERGEFEIAVARELVPVSRIREIGARLVDGKCMCEGRTIFDSSGVAVQDCAVAALVSHLLSDTNG